MRGDALGEWLPLALADIMARLMTIFGGEVPRRSVLAAWGLEGIEGSDEGAEPEGSGQDPAGDAWLAFMIKAGAKVETAQQQG